VAAPSENNTEQTHVFHLTTTEPTTFDGGSLRGGARTELSGAHRPERVCLLCTPGCRGIREPHWHPTAWELTFIISGSAKWTILGTHPTGKYQQDVFTAAAGDLVFIPQGAFHYFENASTIAGLDVLVVFNTSSIEPNDDIGIVGTLNSIPRDVLAATFGVLESAFAGFRRDGAGGDHPASMRLAWYAGGVIDPVLLRTFLTVAESGGFSEAARRLGLGQSTVSQQVRRLEAVVGRSLFERDTHSVSLTGDGEAMTGFARNILFEQESACATSPSPCCGGGCGWAYARTWSWAGCPRRYVASDSAIPWSTLN